MDNRIFDAEHVTLGFIGLGNMGSPMVRRLLAAGYRVQVYDRQASRTAAFEKAGATVAPRVEQLAKQSDVLISCLPDDAVVQSVYAGPDGMLRHAKPDAVMLEMSTISPDTSREIAKLGGDAGIRVLDVAISGSTPAAERGELVLFAGGDPDVFEGAEPIFRAIATKYFHLGPSGAGTTMKLVVNAILGIGMQAIAESVALGEKAGLDRNLLLEVLAQTAVVAAAHRGKLERAARGDFSPQFPLRLMNKDFGLILEMAAAKGASMPADEAAFQVNFAMMTTEQEADFSVVMKYMEGRVGKKRATGTAI
jgi:3-hydroxyisobutyrate dehydrogenase